MTFFRRCRCVVFSTRIITAAWCFPPAASTFLQLRAVFHQQHLLGSNPTPESAGIEYNSNNEAV
jgi:hypothetical protein